MRAKSGKSTLNRAWKLSGNKIAWIFSQLLSCSSQVSFHFRAKNKPSPKPTFNTCRSSRKDPVDRFTPLRCSSVTIPLSSVGQSKDSTKINTATVCTFISSSHNLIWTKLSSWSIQSLKDKLSQFYLAKSSLLSKKLYWKDKSLSLEKRDSSLTAPKINLKSEKFFLPKSSNYWKTSNWLKSMKSKIWTSTLKLKRMTQTTTVSDTFTNSWPRMPFSTTLSANLSMTYFNREETL
jgi:hypothetical protein